MTTTTDGSSTTDMMINNGGGSSSMSTEMTAGGNNSGETTTTTTSTTSTTPTTRNDNNTNNSNKAPIHRSGSFSSILRGGPGSNPGTPLKRSNSLGAGGAAGAGVTLLSLEQLPRYSSERFYLLSEVEMNAHSILFLSDEMETAAAQEQEVQPQQSSPQFEQQFPRYCVLYFLWAPDCTTTTSSQQQPIEESKEGENPNAALVQTFVEGTVLETVRGIEQLGVRIAGDHNSGSYPSSDDSSNNQNEVNNPNDTPVDGIEHENADSKEEETIDQQEQDESKEQIADDGGDRDMTDDTTKTSKRKAITNLYIVVDLVDTQSQQGADIDSDGDGNGQQQLQQNQQNASSIGGLTPEQQEQLIAQQLAKYIAMHSHLRSICHGVTVCVSNHVRACPGIELCMNAVNFGANDRRQYKNSKRNNKNKNDDDECATTSLIGIMARERDDMLGISIESSTVADAAQGVTQYKIVAEWNSRGNIIEFAKRAHAVWRIERGLPPPIEPIQHRKIPKRLTNGRIQRIVPPAPLAPALKMSSGFKAAQQQQPQTIERIRDHEEMVTDLLVGIIIVLYVLFHFRNDLLELLYWLVPSLAVGKAAAYSTTGGGGALQMMEELVQYLREFTLQMK